MRATRREYDARARRQACVLIMGAGRGEPGFIMAADMFAASASIILAALPAPHIYAICGA